MGQADRDTPVKRPAEPSAPTAVGAETRWPTWEDVAKLHRIPGADGGEPPAATPDAGDEAESSAPVVDVAPTEDETVVIDAVCDEPDDEVEVEPEPGSEAEAGVEPESAAEPDPEPAETVVVEPVPEAEAAQDQTTVIEPVAVDPPARVSAFPATSVAPAQSPRVTAGPVPIMPPEAPKASVLDEFDPLPRERRWPLRLAIVLGVVVLLGGAYVGASYALGSRVPPGATVAGVDVGGLRSAAAVQRLTEQLAAATSRPLAVTANDVHAELDPREAGLTFDPAATVDGLVGVDLADPARLWRQVTGVGEVAPVTSADVQALDAAIQALTGTLREEPVDGTIVFVDGQPHATPATDGWQVDEEAAVQQIAETWLVGARPLLLPTVPVEPDITQAETDQVVADVARRVSGGPVTVAVGERTASLDAATLAANASFVPQDGTLVLTMNGESLREVVLAQLPDLLTPSTDAGFAFEQGVPVILPGEPGTTLDPAQVAQAVGAAASKPSGRDATVELVPTDPAETTSALEALGVNEIVSEFSTPLTSDRIRDINIEQGAANLTGDLIRPGETFSLTEALGPLDAAHGFVQAGAIVNGEHTDAWGGGLSQLSTTMYNVAFFAGFELTEHHPHSEWFSRYPEGRESTLFTGSIDLKWTNNTPYGALLQAWVADRRLYVRVWSTRYWTVESTTSARWGVRAPTTAYSQSPTCVAQGKGNPGFSVKVTRLTYLGTELTDTEDWTTTYKPQNEIVCGPPPAATG